MVTIDASVLVASDAADETGRDQARAFLHRVLEMGIAAHEPTLAVVEVTAAVARRTGDAALARAAGLAVLELPGVVLHDLDARAAAVAAGLASDLRIRGADAVYAATALMHGTTLVTLDRELASRSFDAFECLTPLEWLAVHGP